MSDASTRTYLRHECAVFRKTAETFGGLSNMAPGYPVRLNGVRLFSVEALYQACRFPHRIEVQRLIVGQHSPMTAKMVSKPHRADSRPDWDQVRVKVMRWCLRVKLATHFSKFTQLLLSTGDRPIVEDSRKDAFWGAIPVDTATLVGRNVLGRLLMELRDEVRRGVELRRVEPPAVGNFLLLGKPIDVLDLRMEQRVGVDTPAKRVPNELPLRLSEEPRATPANSSTDRVRPTAERRFSIIHGLEPYTEYKQSRLSWLGKIPSLWDEQPGVALFREKKEKNLGLAEKRVLSLSYGRIVVKPEERLHGLVPESFETYQIVNPGDIIIRSTDLQNDWNTPRVGLVRDRGIITSAYLCFKNLGSFTPEYAFLLLQSYDLQKFFYGLGSGLRQNLDFGDFKRLPFPIPPVEEQEAIVRFLEHANARIERALQAKRKLIALLNEQKQAIIRRAVTKGLDPAAPLKPSGIPWLGDIPKHWEVIRCGRLFREVVDTAHPNEQLLSIDRFKGIILQSETGRRTRAPADRSAYKRVRAGQLAYNLMNAFMGALGFSKYDGIVSPAYAVAEPTRQIETRYFHNLLRTADYTAEYNRLSYGIMYERHRLYFERFKLVPALVPTIEEQRAIAHWIDTSTVDLERAFERAQQQIELIREYRTRLTADVVTGKLDVRELTKGLLEEELLQPEEAGEQEDVEAEEELAPI